MSSKQGTVDSELMLDVGQANELKLAFRRGLWTNAEIKGLCQGDLLSRIRSALHGHARIVEAVIDSDGHGERVPNFYRDMPATIIEHAKLGDIVWNPFKVRFYHAFEELGGICYWPKVKKALAGKKLLNATMMEYLIAHQALVPESWPRYADGNQYSLAFAGTVYRTCDGAQTIRVMMRYGDERPWHESDFLKTNDGSLPFFSRTESNIRFYSGTLIPYLED